MTWLPPHSPPARGRTPPMREKKAAAWLDTIAWWSRCEYARQMANLLREEFSSKFRLIFLAIAQWGRGGCSLLANKKLPTFDLHWMSKERLTESLMTTMECTWPENLSGSRKMVIEKLLLGRSYTNRLRTILLNPDGRDQLPSAQELVSEISRSFTDALSTLSSGESDEALSQIAASSQLYSPGWDGRKSEESGESSKSSTKDRRGCYKRR